MLFSADFLEDFLQSEFIQQNPQYINFIHSNGDETTESTSADSHDDSNQIDIEDQEYPGNLNNTEDNNENDAYIGTDKELADNDKNVDSKNSNDEEEDDNIDLVVLTDSDSDMEDEEIIEEEIKDPLTEHTLEKSDLQNMENKNNLSDNVVEDVVNVILKEKPEFQDFNNFVGESNDEQEETDTSDDEVSEDVYEERSNEYKKVDSSDDETLDDVNEEHLNGNEKRPKLKQGRIPKLRQPQGKIPNLRKRKDEGIKIVNNVPIELSDESSDEENTPIELSDESANEEEVSIKKKTYKYSGVTITKINENQENGFISNRRRENVIEGKSAEEFLLRERRNKFTGYDQDYENTVEENYSYYEDYTEYYDEDLYFEEKYNCPIITCDLVFSDEDVEYGEAVYHIRFEHKELSLDDIIEKLEHFEDIVSDNKYNLFEEAEVLFDLTDTSNQEIILKKSEKLKTANTNDDIIEFECEYVCEVCRSEKMSHGAAFLHLTVHHDFTNQQIDINLR